MFVQTRWKAVCCFHRPEKAFDLVRQDMLLNVLCSAGISTTFINAVKAIYSKVLSCVRVNGKVLLCVRVNGKFTAMFNCPQGCVLSRTPFSIAINEIATSVANKGKHGIQLLPGLTELFILLFADNLAGKCRTAGFERWKGPI